MKESNSLDSQLHKVLSAITAQIVENYNPERIILFGSLINGKTPPNDIDLFLIKNTNAKRHIDRVREIRKFLPNEVPIDLIVYTPQEVENALAMRSYFVEDILKEGKVLYEA